MTTVYVDASAKRLSPKVIHCGIGMFCEEFKESFHFKYKTKPAHAANPHATDNHIHELYGILSAVGKYYNPWDKKPLIIINDNAWAVNVSNDTVQIREKFITSHPWLEPGMAFVHQLISDKKVIVKHGSETTDGVVGQRIREVDKLSKSTKKNKVELFQPHKTTIKLAQLSLINERLHGDMYTPPKHSVDNFSAGTTLHAISSSYTVRKNDNGLWYELDHGVQTTTKPAQMYKHGPFLPA